MRRLLAKLLGRRPPRAHLVLTAMGAVITSPDRLSRRDVEHLRGKLPRVVPPTWASDDDLALLRKAGLL